jgi:DHA2 family multidrug resistance protein-like MFS transporter
VARTLGWCIGSALVTLVFSVAHDKATILCLELASGFAIAGAVASVSRFSARR